MPRILPLLLLCASSDPDGDGLSNFDEFLAQTDPLRADTDGDGLSDTDEVAGLSSGVPDLDPLAPATFLVDEPDTDENGIPDLWDGTLLPPFWGTDAEGFPEYVDFPEPAATNYDVRLTVTSSRHALLDWGDGTLLLPVCTNLVLRLRLGSDAVKTVTLSPAPSAASSPGGPWKASVRGEWDSRRSLPTEGDRVALGDGTMVDRSVSESRFVGVLPTPTRASTPWGPTRPDMVFGRNCPVAHDATIRVGWTHDTDRLWVRNLVLVPDGTSWGETDHCIAIDWEPGLEVDLDQYLSSESLLVKDVIPYIQALQLDGNPACPDNPLSFLPEEVPATLSFPSLRQGIELGHYLDCRPSLPTGTTTVP